MVHVIAGPLTFTGDEPRYAAEGVALYSSGTAHILRPDWEAFLHKSGLIDTEYSYSDITRNNPPSLGPGLVFGGALRLGGLNAARWLNFILACVGLLILFHLLSAVFRFGDKSNAVVLWTIASISLSLPFVPYVRLLYPEVLLFVFSAYALSSLASGHRLATVLSAAALPFIHIRSLPLSLAFVLMLTYDSLVRRNTRPQIARDITLYLAVVVVYFFIQHATWGSLIGPAFASHNPTLAAISTRITMQLYDVRHGLIVYSPLYLVGLAGLLAGALQRHRLCGYSLALLVTYVGTFMWSSASESWTARFWVAAIPFLAVGLAFWLREARTGIQRLPAAVCIGVSLMNTIIFSRHPLWFLENRRVSVSYAALFNTSHVHLGLFLPIDADAGGLPSSVTPITLLLLFTVLTVAFLTLALVSPRLNTVASVATLLMFSIPVMSGARHVLPKANYRVSSDVARGFIIIAMRYEPQNISAIQFDRQLPLIWDSRRLPALLGSALRTLRRIYHNRTPTEQGPDNLAELPTGYTG